MDKTNQLNPIKIQIYFRKQGDNLVCDLFQIVKDYSL